MSDTNERDAAVEELLARERERLGGPPTPEEVAAYARGELSDADAARVRALLVVYPESAELLTQRVADDADAILSDDELERDWASIRRRISTGRGPAVAIRKPLVISRLTGIAALVSIAALAGLLAQSRSTVRRLTAERDQPRLHGIRHELIPIGAGRGPSVSAPYPLTADEPHYLLALLLYDRTDRGPYRLEIVDLQSTPPRTIWSTRIAAPTDRALEISIPRSFFKPGIPYRLDLYRAGTAAQAPAASYLVRVEGSVDPP